MSSVDISSAAAGNSPEPAKFKARYGPWAVVAGASDGTGAEYSAQLAALGLNLLLVARREGPLNELAARLRSSAGVEVKTLQLDLSSPDAGEKLLVAAAPYEVGLYVSNAGADPTGVHFLDQPIQAWRALIQRNIVTLTEACHGFAGRMLPRGRGGLILMGSGAGLGGQPRVAVYSGTKGFDLNLAESLWAELQPHGIDVLSVVAPAMNTETLQKVMRSRGLDATGLLAPGDVVRQALATLPNGPTCIFSSGFDAATPEVLAESRRQRVVAVSQATRMFFGDK
jgi:short-subunit dehydrogenase